MIVHLMNDEKFVEKTVLEFEKYLPNKNIFIIDTSTKTDKESFKYVAIENNKKFGVDLAAKNAVSQISSLCYGKVDCIFIHSYSLVKGYISLELNKNYDSKIIWGCNGADLYGKLMIDGNYELFDQNATQRRIRSFAAFYFKNSIYSIKLGVNLFKLEKIFYKKLHYFCTWNSFDYELFNKNYDSNSKLISFHYPTTNASDYVDGTISGKSAIMVNQSASKNGNHITILNKLVAIDKDKLITKLIVPLSYGAKNIIDETMLYGNKNLPYCFTPLTKFLNKEEYFDILKEVKCAIFGHRRQEAANNILFLLGFGAKVFLRKDNNLLNYFKQKGFFIYEYESDLKDMKGLEGLNEFQQNENKKLVLKEMDEESMRLEYMKIADVIGITVDN